MLTINEARVSNGKFLYWFAWIIELCAASAGFLFAYLTLAKTGQQNMANQTTEDIHLILATIPFVIVGIVELTKIPLVSTCYLSTSRVSKYLFGLSLILVSIITFETFLNGFQLGFHMRLSGLTKIQKEIKATNVEKKALKKEKNDLDGLTLKQIDLEYTDQKRNLTIRKEEAINSIQKEMENDENRLGGPQQKIIEQELDTLRSDYDSIAQDYNSRETQIKQTFEQKILGLQVDTKIKKEELSGRIKTKDSEIEKKTSEIKQKEAQINEIRKERLFDNEELKEVRSEYKLQRSNIEKTIENKKINYKEREKELKDNIEKIKKEIDELGTFESESELVEQRKNAEAELKDIQRNRMDLDIQSQLDKLHNNEKKEIETTKAKIKQEKSERIQNFQNDIAMIRRELAALKSEQKGLSLQQANTTIGGQRQDFLNQKTEEIRRLNAERNEELKNKNEQIDNKQTLLSKVIFDNQRDLEPRIQAHRRAIDNIKNEIRGEEKEAAKRKEESIRDYNRRDKRVAEIRYELAMLDKRNSTNDAKLFDAGEKTFIGRWTNHFFNDLEPIHLKLVANIWFGSLAAITAFMGTILAFASMVLRYGHEKENKPLRITRAIQRYFSVARKIKRKPKIIEIEKEVEKIVEVVKEVPITKVEIKEVPKEVIRKHIVHVPIASDDLNILNFDEKISSKSKEDSKTTDDKNNPEVKT
jgi:hypothetical protein